MARPDQGGLAEEKVAHRGGTQVTVQVPSITKAKQAAELLDAAGAVDERPGPNRLKSPQDPTPTDLVTFYE